MKSIVVISHIGEWGLGRRPYISMLTLTSKIHLKPRGRLGWKPWEWVDWEAQRGQYLTGLVCCATLKDMFWGHAWLPRINLWGSWAKSNNILLAGWGDISMNIYLRLYIDRFNPFGSFTTSYSCWLVILTVYNLPLGMCIRSKFMFLSKVIPGPNILGQNIDVCLRPLINELKQLWLPKTLTYDVLRK
jgi:hypothetical protein